MAALKKRVRELEGTVDHLQAELAQLKWLVEEERRLRLQKETASSLIHI